MYYDEENLHMAFESITEMAHWANTNINEQTRKRRESSEREGFYGKTTWEQMVARCALGYDAEVPNARKLLDKLETSISIEALTYESSVAGCFPIVPEYLAGEPECMLEQAPVHSDTAPLSIYIDLTTSAGIEADQYRRRGLAVLALTILLSTIRPVSLHICTVMGTGMTSSRMKANGDNYCIASARIETAPLDLTRAAFALTDVCVPRRLFYGIGEEKLGLSGGWPTFKGSDYAKTTSTEYIAGVKRALNIDSEVLYVPAVSLLTPEVKQMINEPVDWINAKLQQFGGVTAEA